MKRPLIFAFALCAVGMAALDAGAGEPASAGYLNASRFNDRLRDAVARGGKRARLTPYGKSFEKRDLLAVELNDPETGRAEDKPGVLLLCGLRGDEAGASEVALRVLERLLTAEDAPTRELLRTRAFYIIPRPNPDGLERLTRRPALLAAGTQSPYDDDGDSREDEDPPADVDGDGVILQMRIADPEGDLRTDPADPRLMIAKGAEKGQWRLLGAEGRDADGDGLAAEDGPGGVNPDRNFPALWQWRTRQPGAGPFSGSEPEVRALMEYLIARPGIAMVDHLRGGTAAAPFLPGTRPGAIPAFPPGTEVNRQPPLQGDDRTLLEALGKKWAAATGSAVAGGSLSGGDVGSGSFADWAYLHLGALIVSPEIWQAPKPAAPAMAAAGEKAWLDWSDREAPGAFTPWRKFQHPQLGEVEIGGWRPFTRDNPPPERLDALADGELKALLEAARTTPRLSLADLRAASRTTGVYEVQFTVANTGGAPTASAHSAANRTTTPVIGSLALPEGAKLLSGVARVQLGQLAVDERKTARWLVAAPAGTRLKVRVSGQRAGAEEREVTLP